MEFTGIVKNVSKDLMTNETNVTFSVNEGNVLSEIEKLKKSNKLKIKAVQYREKRSLDANAYMWVLLQKMADVLNTSKDELYIEILSRYGVFTHVIVEHVAVSRVKAEWRLVKELGEVRVNNKNGIQLQCYFGSSTYDTKEMARLIDGLVYECKELDIETLTPGELEVMKGAWGT